ncbi:MAG TPA: 2-amino-4-hydroxy-6-hydroxymethyldihydropteridine diphosphokinase [Acidiferrobacterales bacterium]|nr:2-amino-4-hydroxy-6-hydroxymethyldihydropteridine diphosphokinase [Acidiferrobacterales bacterium]
MFTKPPLEYAYIGLGSNLNDPVKQVRAACTALAVLARLQACSSLYLTAPIGSIPQPDFINAVCRLETRLSAAELLRSLLAIESVQGRVRHGEPRGGPRVLDLDLLLYGNHVIHEPGLIVPHPRLHERAFVLQPLAEIDPDLDIPKRGRVTELLARCSGQTITRLEVSRLGPSLHEDERKT